MLVLEKGQRVFFRGSLCSAESGPEYHTHINGNILLSIFAELRVASGRPPSSVWVPKVLKRRRHESVRVSTIRENAQP